MIASTKSGSSAFTWNTGAPTVSAMSVQYKAVFCFFKRKKVSYLWKQFIQISLLLVLEFPGYVVNPIWLFTTM